VHAPVRRKPSSGRAAAPDRGDAAAGRGGAGPFAAAVHRVVGQRARVELRQQARHQLPPAPPENPGRPQKRNSKSTHRVVGQRARVQLRQQPRHQLPLAVAAVHRHRHRGLHKQRVQPGLAQLGQPGGEWACVAAQPARPPASPSLPPLLSTPLDPRKAQPSSLKPPTPPGRHLLGVGAVKVLAQRAARRRLERGHRRAADGAWGRGEVGWSSVR
jgi:hypothetical protein